MTRDLLGSVPTPGDQPAVEQLTIEQWTLVATADGVEVGGEIDASTAPALLEAILSTESHAVRADLSGVGFLDSSGLRALLEAHRTLAAADRSLVIVSPSRSVHRLFELAGVIDVLRVEQ